MKWAGIALLAAGMFFTMQGAGIIHWPPESFMVDQRDWVAKGSLIALAGVALIIVAQRRR